MRSSSRITLHGCLALLLVGIPAGAALAATLAGPKAQPMSEVPERPGLSFYQYLVDLGSVRPSEEVWARFGFVNTSDQTVTIEQLVPSCGCLQPTLRRDIKTYGPGKAGDFQVRVRTANEKAGQREYTIRVKYKDPQPREELLTFRVNLPENQVSITPRALSLYQLNGKPSSSEFTITDRRERPLEPLRLVSSSSLVQAELGEKTVDENGHHKYKVKVTVAGQVPNRKMFAHVKVYTNDSTYRVLQIPLSIQGAGTLAKALPETTRRTDTH